MEHVSPTAELPIETEMDEQLQLAALAEEALPFVFAKGFAVKPPGTGAVPPAALAHAPFALLPRKVRGSHDGGNVVDAHIGRFARALCVRQGRDGLLLLPSAAAGALHAATACNSSLHYYVNSMAAAFTTVVAFVIAVPILRCHRWLLPPQINRAAFQHAYSLAAPFNRLVDDIARRPDWLARVLRRWVPLPADVTTRARVRVRMRMWL